MCLAAMIGDSDSEFALTIFPVFAQDLSALVIIMTIEPVLASDMSALAGLIMIIVLGAISFGSGFLGLHSIVITAKSRRRSADGLFLTIGSMVIGVGLSLYVFFLKAHPAWHLLGAFPFLSGLCALCRWCLKRET